MKQFKIFAAAFIASLIYTSEAEAINPVGMNETYVLKTETALASQNNCRGYADASVCLTQDARMQSYALALAKPEANRGEALAEAVLF